MIRLARPADLVSLPDLERAAGAPFRDIGMPEIADDGAPAVEELSPFQADGRCWVWDVAGTAAAYAIAEEVDGFGHVDQVSVLPGYARRGLGRALLDTVDGWAAERGLPGLTLTTFVDVPWNAPYYARLGFRVVPVEEQGPQLRRIRETEIARGLDRWPRVAMVRFR
ncbi:GNAT family N-acetyltransferase [Amycolatopsis benzoatilytica]|uniref:GNAT family N-acetyltransferase n=1 Tax=Amycolatopsis benzoatilytica TaxID=346045 RepID=UPI000366BAE9|nr:GNAT family N-acetyltransferase [Amycolatopsis benzoatilytica]